jgi:hypothetical protein
MRSGGVQLCKARSSLPGSWRVGLKTSKPGTFIRKAIESSDVRDGGPAPGTDRLRALPGRGGLRRHSSASDSVQAEDKDEQSYLQDKIQKGFDERPGKKL